MNTFFISDTHWGHTNIIQYSQRPFESVEEMNEALINNWNSVVRFEDEIYHLGDVSFQTYKNLSSTLRRLNGKIHLILGNHDKVITKNKNKLLEDNQFRSIQDYKELKINEHHLVLFHFALRTWNKAHRGSIMLYGHSHGSLPPFGKSVDVGVDCKEITHEYRPVALCEILEYMENKRFIPADHHEESDSDENNST